MRPVVIPPLLVINLMRFKHCDDGGILKNTRKVTFPAVLDVQASLQEAGVREAAVAAPVLAGSGSLRAGSGISGDLGGS